MLGGLIKQDIGVVRHRVFRTPHSLALVGDTGKPKVVSGANTYDEKGMPRAERLRLPRTASFGCHNLNPAELAFRAPRSDEWDVRASAAKEEPLEKCWTIDSPNRLESLVLARPPVRRAGSSRPPHSWPPWSAPTVSAGRNLQWPTGCQASSPVYPSEDREQTHQESSTEIRGAPRAPGPLGFLRSLLLL